MSLVNIKNNKIVKIKTEIKLKHALLCGSKTKSLTIFINNYTLLLFMYFIHFQFQF